MQIRIINYRAISNLKVQAFVDVELDGWLRFIGLNLMRDGSLRAAQLKAWSGTGEGWRYFPAVVIPDDDLRELLVEEILTAVRAHQETLPPQRRLKPPRPPAAPPTVRPDGATSKPEKDRSPVNVSGKPSEPAKTTLPPPRRLLASAKGGRL